MSVNVKLIQESFAAIKPHAAEVVEHFYEELFNNHPEAKSLFKGDMAKQQKMLLAGLSHIVEYLEEPDHVSDYLRKMGARHHHYEAKNEHFEWVGEALLDTFAYYFGTQWTDELAQSWTEAYGIIASEMQFGMVMESKKVVEMHKEIQKEEPKLSTLQQAAKQVAEKLFNQAVVDFMKSAAFQQVVEQKAREMLNQAVELEAQKMLSVVQVQSMSA